MLGPLLLWVELEALGGGCVDLALLRAGEGESPVPGTEAPNYKAPSTPSVARESEYLRLGLLL